MSTPAEMLAEWFNGTPTGGPESDGRYPLIYKDGETYLVYCPAAQALNPVLSEQPIEIFSESASEAAADAALDADAADASRIAAAASAANANTSKVAAAASATAAATSATNAAASATAAGTSATNAAASATAASGSATTASTAKTAAETARDLANAWAATAQDVVVSGGEYSAKHWAQKAQAAVTGTLKYKGAWSATGGAYPTAPAPVTGDFWKISAAGTISSVVYDIGDQILYNGSGWDKIDNTELVTSVAGRTGPVTLTTADLTNFATTDAAAKDRANHTGTQTAGTISNFASTVRATTLFGLAAGVNAVITAADSVLSALQNLQAQITALISSKYDASLVASGTYTPTASNLVNVASVTPGIASYLRVGNMVYVTGTMSPNVTSASINTTLELSLPIAPANFTATSADNAGGTGAIVLSGSGATAAVRITPVSGTQRVQVLWNPPNTAAPGMNYSFMYRLA